MFTERRDRFPAHVAGASPRVRPMAKPKAKGSSDTPPGGNGGPPGKKQRSRARKNGGGKRKSKD